MQRVLLWLDGVLVLGRGGGVWCGSWWCCGGAWWSSEWFLGGVMGDLRPPHHPFPLPSFSTAVFVEQFLGDLISWLLLLDPVSLRRKVRGGGSQLLLLFWVVFVMWCRFGSDLNLWLCQFFVVVCVFVRQSRLCLCVAFVFVCVCFVVFLF